MEPHPGEDKPHVPPPSLWPVGFAIGIACILVGLIVNPIVIIPIGVAITAIFAFLWIRDASAEYRHVPEVEPEPELRPAAETAPALPANVGEAAMPEPDPDERFPRNKFLEFSTLGLGAAIGGIVTLPVLGFAVVPAFTQDEEHEIDLGPLENFPENQFVIATFLTEPEKGEVSRRTAYIRNNGVNDEGQQSLTIVSNRCVHLGCPTQVAGVPQEDEAQLVDVPDGPRVRITPTIGGAGFNCPCHGGAYDPEGNRTAGPPVRALDRYAFKIADGRLVLLDPFSVSHVEGQGADAVLVRYDLAGPGIHVDGPEALLYPIEAGDL